MHFEELCIIAKLKKNNPLSSIHKTKEDLKTLGKDPDKEKFYGKDIGRRKKCSKE